MAAGTVLIPWYATVFRGDKLAAAVAEIAPVAMRYGATDYRVLRNLDDKYKINQFASFEAKSDWERYWNGPEFIDFRVINSSYYQVPIIYTWNELLVEGGLGNGNGNGNGSAEPAEAPPVGDLA
jgi:hypothetical protein